MSRLLRFRAALDEHTCEECRQLDGQVRTWEAWQESAHPPLHGIDAEHDTPCRCRLEDETDEE